MKTLLSIAILAISGLPGQAFEVGSADYRFSSDLAAEGFSPFAASGAGNAIYGMARESDQYLCFIMDAGADQATRQRVLLAELAGDAPLRTVPNIPVVCILTQ